MMPPEELKFSMIDYYCTQTLFLARKLSLLFQRKIQINYDVYQRIPSRTPKPGST